MASNQQQIYQLLASKGTLKQKVFDKTLLAFRTIKGILNEIEQSLNSQLSSIKDARVRLRYKNINVFQAELKVAGDLLVFYMHSNVFKFHKSHPIWKSKLLKEDADLAYTGVIYIYNFLADSFKYERTEDMGYLIARLFVPKQDIFWLENITANDKVVFNLEPYEVSEQSLRELVEQVILFALQFDLTVLPYDKLKLTTVEEIMQARKIGSPTGKKVGFSAEQQYSQNKDKLFYTGA